MSKGHIYRNLSILILLVFVASFLFVDMLRVRESIASVMGLPEPTQLLSFSPDKACAVLRGLKVNPDNPLEFDFILEGPGYQEDLRDDAKDMINYFLSALTFSKDSLWVNLSPYEEDRVIEDAVARTELGQDMLEQDYILKQLVSSATYPESDIGRDYWQKINSEADKVQTSFNKVWVVSKEASVIEHENMVLIDNAVLEAKTEADYFAQQKSNSAVTKSGSAQADSAINDIIIPSLNQELNNGAHFIKLRRMYNSIILATWFKQKFVESFYSAYFDKQKTEGIDTADRESKEKIFNLYSEAFKKGVYNLVKTEKNSSGLKVKRNYFSGGNAVAETTEVKISSSVEEFAAKVKDILAQSELVHQLKIKLGMPSVSPFEQKLDALASNELKSWYAKKYMAELAGIVNDYFDIRADKRDRTAHAVVHLVSHAIGFAGATQLTSKETNEIYKYISENSNSNHDVIPAEFFTHILSNGRLENFQVGLKDNLNYGGLVELFKGDFVREDGTVVNLFSHLGSVEFYKESLLLDKASKDIAKIRDEIRIWMYNQTGRSQISLNTVVAMEKEKKIVAKKNELASILHEELYSKGFSRENIGFALDYVTGDMQLDGEKGLKRLLNRRNNLVNYEYGAIVKDLDEYKKILTSIALTKHEFEQFKAGVELDSQEMTAEGQKAINANLKESLSIFYSWFGLSKLSSKRFDDFIYSNEYPEAYVQTELMDNMRLSTEELNTFIVEFSDAIKSQMQPLGILSSSVFGNYEQRSLDEYLKEMNYVTVDDRDIDELNPSEHRFVEQDYALELIEFAIKKLSFDEEYIESSDLSFDVVKGYFQDLLRGQIDLDKMAYLLNGNDEVSDDKRMEQKMDIVVAMRESLNDTQTFKSYSQVFPVKFSEYRSLIPTYLGLYEFVEKYQKKNFDLSADEIVETLFNIELNIANVIYGIENDVLKEIEFKNLTAIMREIMDASRTEAQIMELTNEALYGELEMLIRQKGEQLGIDVDDFETLSSSVKDYTQGGIDLKDIDVQRSGSSSALMEFSPFDISSFSGFSFSIISIDAIKLDGMKSWLGGLVNVY